MPLTGHSDDVSLADLLQANALGRNTCRVMVTTPRGRGVFYLEEGTVVDAAFGDLDGRDALFALLGAPNSTFHVESGLTTHRRTIHDDWQHLLIEAMRREDGGIPVTAVARPALTVVNPAGPAPAVASVAQTPAARVAPVLDRPAVAAPAATVAPAPHGRRQGRSSGGKVAAIVLGAAGLAAVGYFAASLLTGQGATTAPATTVAPSAAPAAPAIEATALTGPGDAQPRLLSGEVPNSPQPDLALSPTVTCRVLVGTDGRVVEARVFRSRLDLARFEEVALEAVRTYRFQPATKGGSPVPAWINLPVTFR